MLGILMLVFYFYLMMIIHSSFTDQLLLHLFYVTITLCLLPMLYFLAFGVYHLLKAIKLPQKWRKFFEDCWIKTKVMISTRSIATRANNSFNSSYYSRSDIDSDSISTVTSSVVCPHELTLDESVL